jgi:hypothetical protein
MHTIRSSVALSNFLGRVIAKLYLPLEISATIVTKDKNAAKTPKSAGVYNLVRIGVIARGITCDRTLPIDNVTKSFRKELAGKYFSFNPTRNSFILP